MKTISPWSDQARTRALPIAGLLCLLGACGTSADVDSSTTESSYTLGMKGGNTKTPPGKTVVSLPSAPIVSSISSVTYDASIGSGVDALGFADLNLRTGARRYFVNSSTGSDGNGCLAAQKPSTPLATLASAISCVGGGQGDQILMAEGTRYAAGLSNMTDKGGYSLAYPTVIQSYDPSDPLNDAKYGRATGGSRPVLNTAGNIYQFFLQGGGESPKYIAVRGMDFNPGNISGPRVSGLPNTNGTPDGILWENNIFRYTGLGLDAAGSAGQAKAQKFIVRNCVFYGQWDSTPGNHAQGIYLANVNGYTIEDSVFWHVGWKIGASRTDDPSVGGPTPFRHAIYAQDDTRNGVVRRNLFFDNATEGGSLRGGITYTQNLGIRNAVAVGLGSGTGYDVAAPNGVDITAAYNAFIGSASITSGANGWGMTSANGTPGSSGHHNVLVYSSSKGGPAFLTDASYNQPSYMDWHHNIAYNWTNSGGSTALFASFPAQVRATFNNNLWDDPSSGTNTNNATAKFPNAYTEASLLAALGYSDANSFINDTINNPEKHVQRQGVFLMLTGYGIDVSNMTW